MKRKLLLGLGLLLSIGAAKAQFLPYNYTVSANLNRGADNDTTAYGAASSWYESPRPSSTSVIGRFFPNITGSTPAYKLRAISYATDAKFELSGEKLTINNSATGLAKVSFFNINNATKVVKFAFDLDLTNYTGLKEFSIAFGNSNVSGASTIINTSSLTAAPLKDIFGSFRVVKSGNLVTQFRNAAGDANPNTASYNIKAGESQRVEIFVNSSNNKVVYTYGNPAQNVDLLANTYHVYVKGVKHVEEFPRVGAIYEGVSINTLSFAYPGGTQEKVILSNISATYLTETNLPVSLTSFTGKLNNNFADLKWSTASESNNSHFDVLRSTDAKNFNVIGSVAGNGTTSNAKDYTFTDRSPLAGNNYYLLKQYDLDGKENAIEKIVAINTSLGNSGFTAYVNENQLIVNVYANSQSAGKLAIYDIAGKEVIQETINIEKGNNNIVKAVPFLQSGVYILKLVVDGNVKSIKFVK